MGINDLGGTLRQTLVATNHATYQFTHSATQVHEELRKLTHGRGSRENRLHVRLERSEYEYI